MVNEQEWLTKATTKPTVNDLIALQNELVRTKEENIGLKYEVQYLREQQKK